jgi:hypothetical protein
MGARRFLDAPQALFGFFVVVAFAMVVVTHMRSPGKRLACFTQAAS